MTPSQLNFTDILTNINFSLLQLNKQKTGLDINFSDYDLKKGAKIINKNDHTPLHQNKAYPREPNFLNLWSNSKSLEKKKVLNNSFSYFSQYFNN
ncbi:hypothetical protein BpHYR1_009276 [Brachionus plicatilis]|uniref:Uncharacterized protein n=1 Tax=Brachionus plicatilis TaxID=10195 RepID=A0A3M7QB91_BRAPC|nr:hypothetical protein BpHYR1_009276 [Brachionus plicatilis]